MKKNVALILTMLTMLLVVVCLAGCKDNKTEPSDATTSETTAPIKYGYSAQLTETELDVYKDDIFVQKLMLPENKKEKFILGFAQNHIAFVDLNFDGNEDICLTISADDGIFNYCCWLYDTQKGEFVYNETLSDFTSISVDNEKKQLIVKNGGDSYVIYEWVNGELNKIEDSDVIPETVTNSVIGSTSSDSTISREPITTKPAVTSNNSTSVDIVTPQPETTASSGNSGGAVNYTPDLYGNEWY